MSDHRSLCIHAHFYQPPREDPYTNQIPEEPGASPYHDWNERILETCYKPNAEIGNFEKISFNIGPTLSYWMEKAAPEVIDRIVDEDRINLAKFGVGNALAQPFNHTILPLATRDDKRTQIHWGIRNFENTFGRFPHGMWLPETAVDLETLEILAESEIQFTILAPWQIKTTAPLTSSPFKIELNNNRSIIVFVYHGELSSRISFDTSATANADRFVEKYLLPEYSQATPENLILISSDGELYGHHQTFRDKFLSHLVTTSLEKFDIQTTYPALWLSRNPVLKKAEIRESTSWSCHHGVERWRGECACSPGSAWKKPLRDALNLLEKNIDRVIKTALVEVDVDFKTAADGFIDIVLGRSSFRDWCACICREGISEVQQKKLFLLFNAFYERQRMFTSCGWFFDDLDRIESNNNLSYAAHAAWLINQVTGDHCHEDILPILLQSTCRKSNRNARDIFLASYDRFNSRSF